MAIGDGKFNQSHSIVDSMKSDLNQKEIALATSIFREAYMSVNSIVELDNDLINALKVSAMKRVITLRGL